MLNLEAVLPQRQLLPVFPPLAQSTWLVHACWTLTALGICWDDPARSAGAGEFGQYFAVEEGFPLSLSSEFSLTGFELKTAAYTVKTHADLIPFLKGWILRKPALFRDKGLFSVGSDPASRLSRGRSGALAPPTGRPEQVRHRRGEPPPFCLVVSLLFERVCTSLALAEKGQGSTGCYFLQGTRISASLSPEPTFAQQLASSRKSGSHRQEGKANRKPFKRCVWPVWLLVPEPRQPLIPMLRADAATQICQF